MTAQRVDRLVRTLARTEPEGTVQEVRLEDRLEHQQRRRLDHPVAHRGNSQRSPPAVRLGDVDLPLHRLRPVSARRNSSCGAARNAAAPGPSMMSRQRTPSIPARVVCEHYATHAAVSAALGAGRSGRTGRKTETPAPAWPCDPVSFSVLRDFQRQPHARLHLRLPRRRVLSRWHAAFSRSGTVVQAGLLTSQENTNPAGGLRSTGVTPLPRYCAPLRLPTGPGGGYEFPLSVVPTSCPEVATPGGASQVPRLICGHPPSPTTPESPAAASARCLAVRYQASPVSEGLGHSRTRFPSRPNRVLLPRYG